MENLSLSMLDELETQTLSESSSSKIKLSNSQKSNLQKNVSKSSPLKNFAEQSGSRALEDHLLPKSIKSQYLEKIDYLKSKFIENFFNFLAHLVQKDFISKDIFTLVESNKDLQLDIFRSFCHKSFTNELGPYLKVKTVQNIEPLDNERLEFLGDAALDLFVSEKLFKLYPFESEGKLSKMRSRIVNESSLAALAKNLELQNLVLLGRGEYSSFGYLRPSILANTFEAFIGAFFLHLSYGELESFLNSLICMNVPVELSNLWDISSLEYFDTRSLLQEKFVKYLGVFPEFDIRPIKRDKKNEFKSKGRALEEVDQFHISLSFRSELLGEVTHQSKKKGIQKLCSELLSDEKFHSFLESEKKVKKAQLNNIKKS